MNQVMEVVRFRDGTFGVRAVGGDLLPHILERFESQIAAERWMMSHTLFQRASCALLKPGGSAAVS